MFRKIFFTLSLLIFSLNVEAKLPEINSHQALGMVHEILKAHATYKELNPELMKRIFSNMLDLLDPTKIYFIQSDIDLWTDPSPELLQQTISEYNKGDFSQFYLIESKMIKAIERRRSIERKIDLDNLPKNVRAEEFKDLKWVTEEDALQKRIERIKALQVEASMKLDEDQREKALQRIKKHQEKEEEGILDKDPIHKKELILSNVLKATASALDTHTMYFTPDEAAQFMINVQQRLFGIGAQLRDDLNGFTVIKIIEGGPAAREKELKVKDRIVAVNEEPVVGMDIVDAVDLIRGKENTPVILTVIREEEEGDKKNEKKLQIKIIRGEVVLKESRFETSYEPYGDGIIGYIKLHSFYQDPESSSTQDLANAIEKLKKEHSVKGIILDLRFNSGGMLSQAVGVTGLFITKGVVVGIKDNTGQVQYLRDLDGKMAWAGPLIVLTNKASASASEIVAQTLQDYGRALVVGDEHSYGKGSFQTFTLNTGKEGYVTPEGEYKVTRGIYYTVSGKTPQMTGVKSDIVLPGPLMETEIGEKFAKFPLPNDSIMPNFDDDLSDIPYSQRARIRALYKFDLQKKLHTYDPYIEVLKKNSAYRVENNKNYQLFLSEVKKDPSSEEDQPEKFGQNDLQLGETFNIMRDLVLLMQEKDSSQKSLNQALLTK